MVCYLHYFLRHQESPSYRQHQPHPKNNDSHFQKLFRAIAKLYEFNFAHTFFPAPPSFPLSPDSPASPCKNKCDDNITI